jgi:hypothetical protein
MRTSKKYCYLKCKYRIKVRIRTSRERRERRVTFGLSERSRILGNEYQKIRSTRFDWNRKHTVAVGFVYYEQVKTPNDSGFLSYEYSPYDLTFSHF